MEGSLKAAIFYWDFSLLPFRIVQSCNPTNLPAGRTPEPFRLEAKMARRSLGAKVSKSVYEIITE